MNGDLSQGGDGIISGALVSGNVIYNNAIQRHSLGGGSGINMDGVQNSRIENNLIYNNHASGISLYQHRRRRPARAATSSSTTRSSRPATAAGRSTSRDGSTGNTVLNNILISDHPFRGAIDISSDSLTGFTSDYNAVISRFTTNGGNSVHDARPMAGVDRATTCTRSSPLRPACS